MKTIKTSYVRIIERLGCYLGESPVELTAECEQLGDKVLVIWTDETLARIVALDLDDEERDGCEEAIEEAFFQHEQEQCRLASVRQRLGAEKAVA